MHTIIIWVLLCSNPNYTLPPHDYPTFSACMHTRDDVVAYSHIPVNALHCVRQAVVDYTPQPRTTSR